MWSGGYWDRELKLGEVIISKSECQINLCKNMWRKETHLKSPPTARPDIRKSDFPESKEIPKFKFQLWEKMIKIENGIDEGVNRPN
jgi:hypothetical protein